MTIKKYLRRIKSRFYSKVAELGFDPTQPIKLKILPVTGDLRRLATNTRGLARRKPLKLKLFILLHYYKH